MEIKRRRNGAGVVLIGAALGAGFVGAALGLWYPGALNRAGSGADAVALAYTFVAPIAMVFGAILGAFVMRFMPLLSKNASIILSIVAGSTLSFSAISYFLRG